MRLCGTRRPLSAVGTLTRMLDKISPCSRNQVNEGKERKKRRKDRYAKVEQREVEK